MTHETEKSLRKNENNLRCVIPITVITQKKRKCFIMIKKLFFLITKPWINPFVVFYRITTA